ncbi:MauE/DoxX family redox-associated membrane protein [Nostocoides sp. F2B08]|uniref:MauE/DoxX family redox-associated membrane protein n=1 Tax=Nostocoides sp. F2B08 TaxID=2653936 RepID=UPI00186AF7C6|nr:MauE/DoxX family redox-associated membrane protein [Tetrasphaera sp. F2B08]
MSNPAAALTLVPITLVLVLLVSAVAKLKARASTASAVRLLRVPGFLKPEWVAAVLPPAEIVLALGMLSPWLPLARVAAVAAVMLFAAYWVVIARAMTFDPRPSCGCFGQIGDQRVTAKTLWRNTVLLAGAAVFGWMTWAQSVTVFSFFSDATTREWLLLLGAAYLVLVAWFVLSPPSQVRQRSSRRRKNRPADAHDHADGSGATATAVDQSEPTEDEYVRVPIPDAILLDPERDPHTLLQLAAQQPVLLVFITCGCPSTYETWRRLPEWAGRLPQVRVLGVETYQLGDLDIAGVRERLFYDPAGKAFQALTMPGTSSAILLGADRLVAGGPVLGNDEIEEFVAEIEEALTQAAPADPVPADAPHAQVSDTV